MMNVAKVVDKITEEEMQTDMIDILNIKDVRCVNLRNKKEISPQK